MKHDATTGGSHRLEAFSDAVFAFACTLLVVSLEVPRDFAELVADLKGFVAFGLAFTILILIWRAHYRLFRHYPLDDSWAVVLNSCLLFVVLLFVYPLKFLAVSFVKSLFGIGGDQVQSAIGIVEQAQLFMIYGGAFAAVFGLLGLLYRHAGSRCQRAGRPLADCQAAAADSRHYLIMMATALVSVGVAWLGWGVRWGLPGWLYMLIGPAAWANGALSADAARRVR